MLEFAGWSISVMATSFGAFTAFAKGDYSAVIAMLTLLGIVLSYRPKGMV